MKKVIVILLLIAVGLSACQNAEMIEVKQTTEPAELLVKSISEIYSTYDMLDDYISRSNLLGKKDERIVPVGVGVYLIDTSYTDGDGVEVVLNFGELGTEEPYGILCKDNKYRAGNVRILMDKRYSSEECEIQIMFDSWAPFYTGNGSEMNTFEGSISMHKEGTSSVEVKAVDLQVTDHLDEYVKFSCENTLIKTEDNGVGIINDKLTIDGHFAVSDGGGSTFEADISESLKKNYTNGCYKNIVAGIIDLNSSNSVSTISVDFDVYGDQACDNLVEITINGKSSIHAID
ncbi:MAG: hypothetical protein JXR19_00445 [Bacteroidia bacterium]